MAVKPLPGAQLDRSHPLAQGLLGCWLMNEGSGLSVYDYSGNDNHGVLTNGPTWVAGPDGGALSFDGVNDRIRVVDFPSVEINNGGATWMCRVYIPAGSLGDDDEFFRQTPDGMYIRTNGFKMEYVAMEHGAVPRTISYSKGYIPTGRWVTIASVVYGDQVSTYYDGNLDSIVDTGKTDYRSGSGELGISDSPGGGEALRALWLYAAIYSRALSADEVAWLTAEPYCMFARPDRWLRVFDFGGAVVGRAYFGTRNLGAQLLRRTGL